MARGLPTENALGQGPAEPGLQPCDGRLGAAHAVHNGLTAIPDAHHLYHGEKVAYGTLVQLVLENAPLEEIETVMALCHAVGLPITLAELHVTQDIEAKMRLVAKAACVEGEISRCAAQLPYRNLCILRTHGGINISRR